MYITNKLIIILSSILAHYYNVMVISLSIKKVPNRILVKIIDQNNKGDGIATISDIHHEYQSSIQHIEHNNINIPNTIPGDEVYIDITYVTRNNTKKTLNNKLQKETNVKLFNIPQYKLHHIKQKSVDRITSLCNISDNCGGCQLQHQDYKAQLLFKKKTIENIFNKQNCFTSDTINMIKNVIPSIEIYHYRNKLQFALQYIENKIKIGLYESNTNKVIDTKYCNIQHIYVNNILQKIHKFLDLYGKQISIYNESEFKTI